MMQIQYQLDMLYIISANMQCQEKSMQIQEVMVCVCAVWSVFMCFESGWKRRSEAFSTVRWVRVVAEAVDYHECNGLQIKTVR